MRSNKEMIDLILRFAKQDSRIRAAYMNGSRTNRNVPKDIFQDYDIVYVVTETAPFINDKSWIDNFGDLIMMQEPDKNDFGVKADVEPIRSYGYLMLFTDGNRIDLHIQTKEAMLDVYGTDKLTLPLLGKDHVLPIISPPTDIDYHVQKPTKGDYDRYTNDFWWCLQNVAKGIWRDELPYAKLMFEYPIRDSLDKIISWWIGLQHDFKVSTGKFGKYFKEYLPAPYWRMYKKTYSNADYTHMWDSIFITCELFRTLAKDVASHFHFTYPIDDDKNMTSYLKHVRELPPDAKEIY